MSARKRVLIIGAGPAGLMAAEVLSAVADVHVFDAMPTAGRKFLMAGVGGMNITHSEAFAPFVARYREASEWLQPYLQQFGADELRQWIHDFGIETFVGTSGRVFPREMKAAPLLRSWLQRLKNNGVIFSMRHRWLDWQSGNQHRFATPDGEVVVTADAVIFAMGGGSWQKLGSDGSWLALFEQHQIPVRAWQPSNCGFELHWSEFFRTKFSGEPIKPVALSTTWQGKTLAKQGELMVTAHGLEGSLMYAVSAELRQQIAQTGTAQFSLDLLPQMPLIAIQNELSKPHGSKSISNILQSRLAIKGVKSALLREVLSTEQMRDTALLAQTIKTLPLTAIACRPLDEAISSAGGVMREALTNELMLKNLPGVFCAGEMLDWEAPTGGYLLTACFATGFAAGMGAKKYLNL